MRRQHRGSKEPQFADPEFAAALCEDEADHSSSRQQAQRKTRQFCRQVQRALNLALEDGTLDGAIDALFVDDVVPAPDCGRLLVRVFIPAGAPVGEALAALGRETPRLRSEVASAISRKRAPELFFVPAFEDGCEDGGNDE